jgi:hypothetical protein
MVQGPAKPILKSTLSLLGVAAVAIAVSAALSGVRAQNQDDDEARAEATPAEYAEFQYATLTGTNNTINATMVPVVTPTGTVYKNITFAVKVAANGAITLVSGTPTVVAAPSVLATAFKTGPYVGPSNVNGGGNEITVSGPGIVVGGTSVWSLTASAGANACTYPASATWWVGPPTSQGNPNYYRLQKLGITSSAYSYGTVGGSTSSSCSNGNWDSGALIGVSQTGSQLTIASFTSLGSFDQSHPLDQITYTFK